MLKILLNNRFIGGAILLNTLITILLTFNTPINGLLEVADHLITILFLTEIIYKIHTYKKDFFKDATNVFDMILILVASIPLFLILLGKHPTDLNYILLLRIFKLFKFIRFGKFIPNFKKLLKDFNRALKASISLILGTL
ncbi:ion transporter, partial [Dysgonomonas sp. OttesenSCG-928-D17]|nr:ion transporter [Dysgonomonas sp. OttesenSCG-928-D17]